MKTTLFKLLPLIVILLMGNITPAFSQGSEKLFQKGLVKEEGEGSLQEAIDIYNQVVEDVSAERSLRANALLHVGICYEKLGQEKAKKTYEKLIADFADQEEIVAIGKNKLSYLNAGIKVTKNDGLTIRQVWSPAEDTYGVSPDGRYLNYIDWDAIAVAVKDLQTGKTWNLNTGNWETWEYPDKSIWAPDSKQLAYFWFNGPVSELHIASIDGSEDRIIFKSNENEYGTTPWPIAWSRDGKYIIAFNYSGDEANPDGTVDQIVMVEVVDGSIRVLRSLEGLQSACCGSLSPDNQFIATAIQQKEGSEQNDIFVFPIDGGHMERVVSGPANDINPLWIPDGHGIVFLSDRMGTTDLWTLQLNNGVPAGEPELIKSNIGERTHLIGMTDNAALYYDNSNMRSDVLIARLDFNTGEILDEPKKISIIEEKRNIKPKWSPDGRYVAYMVLPSYQNNALGYKYEFIIYDTETQSIRQLKTNLYGASHIYWRQHRWSPDGKFLLVHGATDESKLQGFFGVDINTGEITSILVKDREPKNSSQPIGFFPILSGNGQDIVYISADKKAIITRNIDTKKEKKIYAGEDEILYYNISPNDTQIVFGYQFENKSILYSIPTSGGEKRILIETQESIKPYLTAWTPDNKYLLFGIGPNGSYEPHEILRIPVNGGNPERVLLLDDLFSQGTVRYLEVHPDGQQVIMDAAIGQGSEIWVMENLLK